VEGFEFDDFLAAFCDDHEVFEDGVVFVDGVVAFDAVFHVYFRYPNYINLQVPDL
jgi:hypothetical protein